MLRDGRPVDRRIQQGRGEGAEQDQHQGRQQPPDPAGQEVGGTKVLAGREPPGQCRGEEEPREDEEDVHRHERPAERRDSRVEADHEEHREAAEAVEVESPAAGHRGQKV